MSALAEKLHRIIQADRALDPKRAPLREKPRVCTSEIIVDGLPLRILSLRQVDAPLLQHYVCFPPEEAPRIRQRVALDSMDRLHVEGRVTPASHAGIFEMDSLFHQLARAGIALDDSAQRHIVSRVQRELFHASPRHVAFSLGRE